MRCCRAGRASLSASCWPAAPWTDRCSRALGSRAWGGGRPHHRLADPGAPTYRRGAGGGQPQRDVGQRRRRVEGQRADRALSRHESVSQAGLQTEHTGVTQAARPGLGGLRHGKGGEKTLPGRLRSSLRSPGQRCMNDSSEADRAPQSHQLRFTTCPSLVCSCSIHTTL